MIIKEIAVDKIDIYEDGTVRVREKTRFFEDGVLLSESNTDSRVYDPGADASKENEEIQGHVALAQTQKKIKDFEDKKKEKDVRRGQL